MKSTKLFLFLSVLLVLPKSLYAQASANLSVRDFETLYQSVETLIGFGLVPSATQGTKPWSANEVHFYLQEAREHLVNFCEKNTKLKNCESVQSNLQSRIETIQTQIDRFRTLPDKTFKAKLLELKFQVAALDSPFRDVPVKNGIGIIHAKVNPFTDHFEGQHFVDGVEYNWDLSQSLQITPYFYSYRQVRFENLFPQTGDEETKLLLHKFYGKFQYKNVQMQIGRDSLAWGQSDYGGILLSAHARPLDMVSIGNDHPFDLPSFFKVLGPVNVSWFMANLGPESFFKYGFLTGYKISIKPASVFEASLSNLVMFGGEGAPSQAGFGKIIGDIFGFSGTAHGASNRILGFDGALTLPFWRHTRLYGEAFFDDRSTSHYSDTFFDCSAYKAGIYLPRLNSAGTLKLRTEATYTAPMFYRHSQYDSGMTLNNLLIGDPLGPDGYRILAKLYWEKNARFNLDFTTSFEGRDSNTYQKTENGLEPNALHPTEDRWRQVLHWQQDWSKVVKSDLHLGFEHVWNNEFNDEEANHFFVLLQTTFRFD